MEPEGQRQLVREIRRWLQQNVSNARTDRETILRFLWGCKGQPDKAKLKMKSFYEARRSTPELFHLRDPFLPNLEALLAAGAFFPLPLRPEQGQTLVVVKAAAGDPRRTPMTDVFKVGVMSVDLLLELDEGLAREGVQVIIDLKGVGLQHALQMTPGLIRKMVHLWQDCYPIRIRGLDFVNAPPSVDLVLNVFRRFLAEGLRQRLRTHGSQMSSLHEVVAPALLPEEYGGTLGPEALMISQWKRKVQAYREWFLTDETLK